MRQDPQKGKSSKQEERASREHANEREIPMPRLCIILEERRLQSVVVPHVSRGGGATARGLRRQEHPPEEKG